MIRPYESPEVVVFGEYSPEDQLTVASFMWPVANTPDTYTIALNQGLSIELDRHFPVRLSRIAIYDYAPSNSAAYLDRLTDSELRKSLISGPQIGTFIVSLSVSRDSRLFLANIQANNPSTPPRLRRAVTAMLRADHYLKMASSNIDSPVITFGGDALDLPPEA